MELVNQAVVVSCFFGGVTIPSVEEGLKLAQQRVTGVVAFGNQAGAKLCCALLVPGREQLLPWFKLLIAGKLGDGARRRARLTLLGKDVSDPSAVVRPEFS